MTSAASAIDTLYTTVDHRTAAHKVLVGPDDTTAGWVALMGVREVTYDFALSQVPTATVVVGGSWAGDIESWANFFKNVRIEIGFDGLTVPVFTGKVMDIRRDQETTSLLCVGNSWPLDQQYHNLSQTFNNVTAAAALATLFTNAKIKDYDIEVPAWTIGTVVPQTIEFNTYGEAVIKVAEPDGSVWWELPTGLIRVRDLYVLDKLTGADTARQYFAMDTDGVTEIPPPGFTTRPRLLGYSSETAIRDTKNRCDVRGATYTASVGGVDTSVDVTGDAFAASVYVLNPDGSQAYNTELYGNELIDLDAKADSVATRIVNFANGLHRTASARVEGDPGLRLGQVVLVRDDRQAFAVLGCVIRYSTNLSQRGFETNLDLLYIGNADSANMAPLAAFRYNMLRMVTTDRVYAYVTFDGSPAYDRDGSIASSVYTSNLGLLTGSVAILAGKIDPAAAGGWTETLTVTDNDGATDAITLTIPVASGNQNVFTPTIWAALSSHFSSSQNGGSTWNDQAAASPAISCDAIPPVNAPSGPVSAAVYGTEDGSLYRMGTGAPTLVMAACGSPIRCVHFDREREDRAWAVTDDGRLFASENAGSAWAIRANLRAQFPGTPIALRRILTGGGVWLFGTDGARPLILHSWDGVVFTQLPTGGELFADLYSSAAADISIYGAALRQHGTLAIILHSASFVTSVYYTADMWNPENWKRATGLPAKTEGFWIAPDYEPNKYVFGYNDPAIYRGDVTSGVMAVTTAPGALDLGHAGKDCIWLGEKYGGIGPVHLIAAESALGDGFLYASPDRFATIGKVRPATSFPAMPVGARAQAVAVSLPLV